MDHFLGGFPTWAVISWDDYEGRPNQRQIVAWDEIEFVSDMGRGQRRRRRTDRYRPEDNWSEKPSVKSGRKGKKFEDRKEKKSGKRKGKESGESTSWEERINQISSLLSNDDQSVQDEGMDRIYAVEDELRDGEEGYCPNRKRG